jgi:prevent-host-death family protein
MRISNMRVVFNPQFFNPQFEIPSGTLIVAPASGVRGARSLDDVSRCGHNDHMERCVVGARELKTRLGTYLRRVREGRTVLVTDRGEPVAELRPLRRDARVPATLLKLSSQRTVTLPVRKSMAVFRPIQSQGRALSDAVLEDREDRF